MPLLAGHDDALLTAWTRRMVFWDEDPLLIDRLEKTRLPLDTATRQLLGVVLLTGNSRDADDDMDDDADQTHGNVISDNNPPSAAMYSKTVQQGRIMYLIP